MRKTVITANWKMNKSLVEASDFFRLLADFLAAQDTGNVEIIVCPPYPYLFLARESAVRAGFKIGAQNVSDRENGAFTGEISAAMLDSLHCDYCIIGHSERRTFYHETNILINRKLKALLQYGIKPIVCVGETLEQREEGHARDIVLKQLQVCFNEIIMTPDIVIAYEPVWAIGTGRTATPQQAQEIHALIREWLQDYNPDTAPEISVLYGGSISPENIGDLLQQPDIDGGLIGGASLDILKFKRMIITALDPGLN
ncbi:MAG: triose-phosphate isomerase [Candidatus Cloacimonetes bacterium]|nr:triose-phosphate isomerase [Candidatus Cloacimonadota bacterium]